MPSKPVTSRRDVLGALVGLSAGFAGCATVQDGDSQTSIDCEPIASPWPTAGANAARTGVAPDATLPPKDADASPLMEQDDPASGGIQQPPVVANGTAYATSRTGHVVARGQSEWTVSIEGQGQLTPTIDCGTVYANVGVGALAFDPQDGSEYWRSETDAASTDVGDATPTTAGDTLYLGTEVVAALEKRTGEQRWIGDYPTASTTWGFATTGTWTVAIATLGSDRGYLMAYDGDGTQQWLIKPTIHHSAPRPTIANQTVYAATDEGTLYAVDVESGIVKWTASIDSNVETGLAVSDGTVFVPSAADGTFRAINASDGSTRWTKQVGYTAGAPAVVDEQVVAAVAEIPGIDAEDLTGFVAFDPATGEVTQRYPVGRAGAFGVGSGEIHFTSNQNLWILS